VSSEAVDWWLQYSIPDSGVEVSLEDLFCRIPDLQRDYANISEAVRYASINEMRFSRENGFHAKVRKKDFDRFQKVYESYGYAAKPEGDWTILTAGCETFAKELPMFVHTYVHKLFGSIPSLHLAEPFAGGARFSQLCITYMVSYVLGMLVRYYPTHWISLIQGDRGDSMWPTINRAQQIVELSYPELVAEMITDRLKEADQNHKNAPDKNGQNNTVMDNRLPAPS
jgi:hypothetical protein